jgi:hypothetical protein
MVKVKEDLTGKKFTRLTALKQTDDYVSPSGTHYAQWSCECDCNDHNIVVVRQVYLKNGHTKSCGCISKELASERWIGNTYGVERKEENRNDLSGEYGILWASNTNDEVLFDLEDANKILLYHWMIGKRGYPVAHIDGEMKTMHTLIGCKGYDHIDRNKLNNRKYNLRPATERENSRNRSRQSNNTSGFIGVSWNKSRNKWESYIKTEEKHIHLGQFENKEDAIRARLNAEAKYFGEFAPQRHLFEEYGVN